MKRTKKHTIHVTKEDLTDYEYMCNSNCPIARALRREFPTSYIRVGRLSFTIDGYNFYKFEDISPKLVEIQRDLAMHRAKPFWFRFEL